MVLVEVNELRVTASPPRHRDACDCILDTLSSLVSHLNHSCHRTSTQKTACSHLKHGSHGSWSRSLRGMLVNGMVAIYKLVSFLRRNRLLSRIGSHHQLACILPSVLKSQDPLLHFAMRRSRSHHSSPIVSSLLRLRE